MPERPAVPLDFLGRPSEPAAPRGATVPMLLHPLEAALVSYWRGLRFGCLKELSVQDGLPVGFERALEKVRLADLCRTSGKGASDRG